MPKRKPSGGRRPGRPQTPPPAVLRPEGEPFEGYSVLAEVAGPVGLILCASLRDAMLWADTPEEARAEAFAPEAHTRRLQDLLSLEMDDVLRVQLKVLARILAREPNVAGKDLAPVCRRISRWAEKRGLPRTATAFAQAAALNDPGNAEYALRVAQLCRSDMQHARAESWYQRTVGLARRRDARSYGRAWLGLGNLHVLRGDYPAAKRAFIRALRSAKRAGLRDVRAEALHDLFGVAVEAREITEAEMYARKAAKAYGARHSRLLVLAHDVAGFWMSQGFFERALRVFLAITNLINEPSERLKVVSNTGRAAGGAGRIDVFVHAWVDIWKRVNTREVQECVASSALNLAYGSAHLKDWDRVRIAGHFAAELARKRKEEQVRVEAEALLQAAAAQRFTEKFVPSPEDPEVLAAADALAGDLVRKLAGYAGT